MRVRTRESVRDWTEETGGERTKVTKYRMLSHLDFVTRGVHSHMKMNFKDVRGRDRTTIKNTFAVKRVRRYQF